MKPWSPVVTATGFDKGNSLFDGVYSVDAGGLCTFAGRLRFGSSAVLNSDDWVDITVPVVPAGFCTGMVAGSAGGAGVSNVVLTLTSAGVRINVAFADFLEPEATMIIRGSYWVEQ